MLPVAAAAAAAEVKVVMAASACAKTGRWKSRPPAPMPRLLFWLRSLELAQGVRLPYAVQHYRHCR